MKRNTFVALALLVLTGASASAQVVRLRGGGSGVPSDNSGQTNFCGPDNATNVEIGSCTNDANAGTGGTNVCVGNLCSNGTGANNVAIGSGAGVTSTGAQSVAIGQGTTTAFSSGVALGAGANAGGAGAIAIGAGAFCTASSICIGTPAGGGALPSNMFVAGSSGNPMNNVFFGKGVNVSTAATAYTINGTGGSGLDNPGGDLILAGGRSTGSATPANVLFQTSTAAGSSSTLQTLTTRLTLSPTTFTSTLPFLAADGAAGAPSIAFSSDADGTGTGFYRSSANNIAVAVDGTARWIFAPGSAFTPNADFNNTFGSATLRLKDIFAGNSIQGGNVKTLTEGAATEFVRIGVPQTAGSNFGDAVAEWTAYATDATDMQVIRGQSKVAFLNKAGTETCSAVQDEQTAAAVSAGTLTCAITCVVGLTDQVGIAANCTSSLTQTTLSLTWRVDMAKVNTVTAQ